MATITYTEKLTTLNCASCSIVFGIPQDFEERRREDHRTFYCPSGHTNIYGGKSEAEKLRKQLEERERQIEAEKARADYWRAEEKRTKGQLTATKGQLTKTRKRAATGVCPEPTCHRSFVDVARHVKSQHPELLEGVTSSD